MRNLAQRTLGYMLDPKMEGWSHVDKVKGVARKEMHVLSHLAHTLGVDMALLHLESITTPRVLSAVEGIPPNKVQHVLQALYAEAVAHATLTHTGEDWVPGTNKVRAAPLVFEASLLEWDVLYEKQILQLCGRIRASAKKPQKDLAGSLAGQICKAKISQSRDNGALQNATLQVGAGLARVWKVPPAAPPKSQHQARAEWKDALYEGAWASAAQRRSSALQVRRPLPEGRQSNIAYIDKVLSAGKKGALAAQSCKFVPNERHQVACRRLLMGASPGLLGPSLRSMPRWGDLADGVQADLAQCPCQCGVSDGVHLFRECTRTDSVRDKCRQALRDACVLPQDQAVLEGMSVKQQEEHGLMAKIRFRDEVEAQVRPQVAHLWACELARLRPIMLDDLALAKKALREHFDKPPSEMPPPDLAA